MSTYTQLLYQITFSTKRRQKVLTNNRDTLYNYIAGILRNKKCKVFIINGVEDHIHILTHIHPTIALSNLVKDIKVSTSKFIKEKELFPQFECWAKGYGAFTYSDNEKSRLIEYIKNQELHHSKQSYEDEFKKLLDDLNVEYNERYLFHT